MKSKSIIRRTMLATLMVLATAAIGLQPLVFSSGSDCTCEANVSVGANASGDESSCCNSLVEEQSSCCSSKPAMPMKCCCNPEATVCGCNNCGCSEDNDSNLPLPAIPTNETTEVVTPTLICAAPLVGYPREIEVKRVKYQNAVPEFAALSSQQTCVLLSRFTC